MTCATITASRASQYPPMLPRKTVDETDRIENDVSGDIDCEAAGITITLSAWSIEPDDDDGALTLGAAFIQGQVTYQPYSGGTAGVSYRIHNDITTSDGLVLRFTVQVVIADTVKIAFGTQ